jgi:group I intron endonuclease
MIPNEYVDDARYKNYEIDTGVYFIVNVVTWKIYVGSSGVSLKGRMQQHLQMLRKGEHHNEYLQRSWNKYGEVNFKFGVLYRCLPEDSLAEEQIWIDALFTTYPDGFNMCPVAGSRLGAKCSEKVKERIRVANIKSLSRPEVRAKISATSKGRKRSAETNRKLSVKIKDVSARKQKTRTRI